MDNRGQFTIIAALLVAIVLAGTLIAAYATIRYDSSQSQTPQTLTATDETNSALLKALGFTVGYYASILQVTGNQSYAYANATLYMNSALQYIASMNPSLGESINMTSLTLNNNWYSNPSISSGTLSVVYDLADLGIYGVNYTASCSLGVQIYNSPNNNQVRLSVTQDLAQPLTSLGQQNFAFYYYNYMTSNWQQVNPSLTPTVFTNGTYLISVPPGINSSAYMVQVTDSRGIMVEASSFNSYNIDFTFSPQSSPAPSVVELLQNGTMLWFGQGPLNVTQVQPIPPISVASLHLCQTGPTSDIPFQVEDWTSGYQIPLGLTTNYTIFSNSQMVVFEVNPSMSQLTFWWNGSDRALQPSAAYKDTCFNSDNPAVGTLSNGNMTLQFSYPNSHFQIKSTVGSVSSTANFMRIDADASVYGSGSPAYVVQYGVVRDIVQEEAEWNNGPTNCPNVYSQIVFTLPANATYYTYQLRLIFINSAAARNINDISPIQLTTSISPVQAMTENGTTNGIPNVSNSNGYFNNSAGNVHHWSQLINDASQGTGIMFTDSANQQLYAFDAMAGKFTGALYVNSSVPVIELDPVTSTGPVDFTSALDLTWCGSVTTFDGINPIYDNNGNSGLWALVEQPPSVTITPQSSAAASINLSPSSGTVGTSVTLSGGGFLPYSQIRITFNGNTVATARSTAYGEIPFGTTFVIPSYAAGSYMITATDTSSNSAWANFTIVPTETIVFQPSGISSDAGTSTILIIDSVPYTYSTLPSSFTWQAGSIHTITASSTVAAGAGKQYAWVSWGDGGAQTHAYTVPMSNATVTVSYKIQWQQTFGNSGLVGDAIGNLVSFSVTGGQYFGTSPISISGGSVWVDNGATVSYTFQNPVSSSITGKQYRFSSVSGPASGYSVSGANTIAGTYVTQWQQTFSSSGLGGDASGNLLSFSVTGGQYSGATSPLGTSGGAIWVDSGASVTYSFVGPVTSSLTGKQYRAGGLSGTNSPIMVSAPNAVSESYVVQWQVGFSQTGVAGSAGSNTVLTIGSTNYVYNTLPSNVWVDTGTTFGWASTVSGGSGTQFVLTGSSGLASPLVTSGTDAATYQTQYQLTVTSAHDMPSPATGSWFNANAQVTESVTSPADVSGGTQYRCTGWSGGSGGVPATGSATTMTFTITGSAAITWNWQTQYQFTVTSAVGTPAGQSSGWYDAGTSITSSVLAAINLNGPPIINYTSTGYTGTGSPPASGTTQTITFSLNSASSITWNWHGLMTLYPDGAGTNTGIPDVNGASTHWQAVSDHNGVDNAEYVYATTSQTGTYTDSYATQDHGSATGTINSVTDNIRVNVTSTSGPYAQTYLALGSNSITGAQWTPTTANTWTSHSNVLSKPGGGSWSWTDIDNLQSGVVLHRSSGTTVECTLVWVVVDFNA
ncbi:MAG: hypothetical protein ABSA79_01140 [Candidatus Bathyarchaeia archaeon]|jgi:hypothetical protein